MRSRVLALAVAGAVVAVPAQAKRAEVSPGCATKSCARRVCTSDDCRARTRPTPKVPRAVAVASWYGPGLYGNRTACGQTLTRQTFGVAHKTMACGTRVRLCAARCTVAPVIDRGPYVPGRTFDLTAPVRAAIGAPPLATVRYGVIG